MSEPPGGEVISYQRDGAPATDMWPASDTVWLSLNQLLERDKSTMSRHISNVFAKGELERSSVVAEFATTATNRTLKLSLDMTAVGIYSANPAFYSVFILLSPRI